MRHDLSQGPKSWAEAARDFWQVWVRIIRLSALLLQFAKTRDWNNFVELSRGLLRIYLDVLVLWALLLGVPAVDWAFHKWILHTGTWHFLPTTAFAVATMLFGVRYGQAFYAFLQRATIGQTDAPPRVARYILLLVPRKYRENLVGDLEEEYRTWVLPTYGRRAADKWYWWQVGAAFGHFMVHLLAGLAAVWRLIR